MRATIEPYELSYPQSEYGQDLREFFGGLKSS